MASPWVKRGYVTHSHIDVAVVHKLMSHIFALPYPNRVVADAALPLDAFTSTPDYTPYEYAKRTFPIHCGRTRRRRRRSSPTRGTSSRSTSSRGSISRSSGI